MIRDCLRKYGRYGEEDCRLARYHGMYNTVVVIVLICPSCYSPKLETPAVYD